MFKTIRIIGMLGVLTLAVSPAAAKGDVDVFIGQNSLTEDRLDDAGVGSPMEFGILVNLDFEWPVSLAFDLLRSDDGATKGIAAEFPLQIRTDVEILDLHVGVRRFFRQDKPLRPYVGGGLSWTKLDVKQVESGSFGGPGTEFADVVLDDGASGVGYWVDAGLVYRFNRFQVGGDLRYSDASATVTPAGGSGSLDLDAGGVHAGVFVGWSW